MDRSGDRFGPDLMADTVDPEIAQCLKLFVRGRRGIEFGVRTSGRKNVRKSSTADWSEIRI